MNLTLNLNAPLLLFRLTWAAATALLLHMGESRADILQDVAFTAGIDGSEQRYVLILPKDFVPERSYSVLIALHGHGSDRWQFVRDGREECRAARDAAAVHNMIYVSPDYRARTSWMGPAAEADMLQILEHLKSEYQIRKVIVSGGSMGGTAALTFAALHPELVDGVVSMNGTANLVEYDQFQDAIAASFGGSRQQVPDEYRRRSAEFHADRLTMPIAITSGGKDTVVPPESVRRLSDELIQRKAPVLLIHKADGGHETGYADAMQAYRFVCSKLEISPVHPPLIDICQPDASIVCLGDSVTGVYYHTGGLRAYPELLETALRRTDASSQVRVINAGISGNTTADGLERLDRDVLVHKPALVTVSFGLNDMTRVPEEQFVTNLQLLVSRCRQGGAQVVLCTPNSVISTEARPVDKLIRYCELIRDLAQQMSVPVCDQFSAGESLRNTNPTDWRLTLSDEIHPNLAGHRLMAEHLCKTITGNQASLSDLSTSGDSLKHLRAKVSARLPARVLAMPPLDHLAAEPLRKLFPDADVSIIPWNVSGLSISEIESSAKETVRAMKPDLVMIAVPSEAVSENEENFIHGYSWIMNWSLSFGHREWDCVVVHPDVINADASIPQADLIRKLVHAQDLPLIDRPLNDTSTAAELLEKSLSTLP